VQVDEESELGGNLEAILGLVVLGAVLFVVISATANQWRDSGPFRAITYWGFLPIWVLYDHVKQYGGSKTLWGFSKSEFAEITKTASSN
jgi:hypothetical protein